VAVAFSNSGNSASLLNSGTSVGLPGGADRGPSAGHCRLGHVHEGTQGRVAGSDDASANAPRQPSTGSERPSDDPAPSSSTVTESGPVTPPEEGPPQVGGVHRAPFDATDVTEQSRRPTYGHARVRSRNAHGEFGRSLPRSRTLSTSLWGGPL
jgi:hypothetical protein